MSGKEKPERYGKPWSYAEHRFAVNACRAGAPLHSICRALKRPYEGVASQLQPEAVDRDHRTGAVKVKNSSPEKLDIYLRNAKSFGEELVKLLGFNPYETLAKALESKNTVTVTGQYATTLDSSVFFVNANRAESLSVATPYLNPQIFADTLNHQSTTMNHTPTPTIETKTFINGCDAAEMTDGQVFEAIRQQEAKKASLEGIKAKPAKLKAQIEAIDKTIAELVAYVDNRNTEK